MNRKNKISTGNFKNAISIKPDDMLNVRSFTIPTNYTLFKSIDDKGNAVEQYYTLKYWTLENDTTKYELGNTYSPLFHWEPVRLPPAHLLQVPTTVSSQILPAIISATLWVVRMPSNLKFSAGRLMPYRACNQKKTKRMKIRKR